MLRYQLYQLVIFFNLFVILYVTLVGFINLILLLVSVVFSVQYIKKVKFSDVKLYKESYHMIPMAILVPVHNEEDVIIHSIRSLLSLEYLNYEVIIINDGSTDKTLSLVIKTFGLRKSTVPIRERIKTQLIRGVYFNPEHPNLILIDKENGGKADALNAGINVSHFPYFVSLDGDSLLDSGALVRIAMAFMEYKYTIAVGGIIRVLNGSEVKNGKVISLALPKSKLAVFQILEYLRAFLVGRTGWSVFNNVLIISGAFGAFLKEPVLEVGGYTTDTVGEDMDLVLKLHKLMREKKFKYRVAFMPDPICWTQVPETIHDLFTQRRRWQVGLIDSLKRHKIMMLNPRYGTCGLLAMPYFFLFEQMGPVVEALGLIIVPISYFLKILSFEFLVAYFIAATIFGVILSIGALIIEEFTFNKYVKTSEFLRLCVYGIIENFSYRQMTVFIRLLAILRFKKYQHDWGKIKRTEYTRTSRNSKASKKETSAS